MMNNAAGTIFIYLGATMPIAAWSDAALTLAPWRLVVLALALLLLRRIPAIFLLQRLIPDIKTNREAIFCGRQYFSLLTRWIERD